MEELELDRFVRTTGRAAAVGGVLGLVAMVTVFVIEARAGGGMMSTSGATAAGWSSFMAACLLVVGLVGVAVRHAAVLSGAGRGALLVLTFATAVTVGATSTLALVVPDLLGRMPEIVSEPPAAVPPTFILSGVVSGIAAIVLAVALRRAGQRGLGTHLLLVGAVVTMVPLPSRFFMLSFAFAALLLLPAAVADDRSRTLTSAR
jgi:hypothetical protein